MRPLDVRRLGLVPYADGLELQRALVEDRKADRIPDTLLLLQHPHVVTIGVKKEGRSHIVAIDLSPDRRDVHHYVRDLEEVMIRVCADFGITAGRSSGFSGAWVPPSARSGPSREAKIGAIGVRISRWVTSHGFAFNVNTDVDYFNLIVPCGISDRGVTSLAAQLGRVPEMREVEDRFVEQFARVFERTVR